MLEIGVRELGQFNIPSYTKDMYIDDFCLSSNSSCSRNACYRSPSSSPNTNLRDSHPEIPISEPLISTGLVNCEGVISFATSTMAYTFDSI